jgi:integrase
MGGRKGRRGWGRIRQLPNRSKRYQASYVWPRMTAARHNAPTTFSTRALAEQWLADERRLIERGQWSPPRNRASREAFRAQTFGDYAARWLTERTLKESSRVDYERLHKKYVTDVLGPVPLHALDAATVRTWFAGLDTTEHRKFKLYWHLHSICATAVSDGLISPNPCALNVRKPARQVKPVILKPDELAAAVNVLEPQRLRAPLLIMAWCGLRWGELGELRRKDISDNAEIVTVARGFDHEGRCIIDTPKSGKGRAVVVPPHIRADVKHHLDLCVGADREALLLTGKSPCGHLSAATVRAAWDRALKDAGCPRVRLHDLRHFAGVMRNQVRRYRGTAGRCPPVDSTSSTSTGTFSRRSVDDHVTLPGSVGVRQAVVIRIRLHLWCHLRIGESWVLLWTCVGQPDISLSVHRYAPNLIARIGSGYGVLLVMGAR